MTTTTTGRKIAIGAVQGTILNMWLDARIKGSKSRTDFQNINMPKLHAAPFRADFQLSLRRTECFTACAHERVIPLLRRKR